jgi:hypothetical protein
VTAGVGVWTFHRNVKLKRAEWLHVLYQKFYENERLKTVRSDLIYFPEKFATMNLLDEEVSKYPDKMQFAEAADDFLNFFEFIGSLHKISQINTGEVEMLFKYYLEKIESNEHLLEYLKQAGYENLVALLGVIKTQK